MSLKSLILDLSNNGGGYLQASLMLADYFLSDNKLILTVNGKTGLKDTYKATPLGSFETGRVVVLIDEGSASASEIVSGSLQDHDRAVIVGRRSFGKGMVQKPIYLRDSSMVRLTIKRFYTPSGRCIQKPYDEGIEKYYEEIYERYAKGELINRDSIEFPDSLSFKTSGGRDVYGGGGITPDIFIPIDTSWNSEFYLKVASQGLQNEFCLEFVNKERKRLKNSYENMQSFDNLFKIDKEIDKDFLKFIEEKGVKIDTSGYNKSKEVIHFQIKALIARNLWNSTAYFYVINNINESYKSALKIIESEDYNTILKTK
jgi:carboxyl-terminal processing protease